MPRGFNSGPTRFVFAQWRRGSEQLPKQHVRQERDPFGVDDARNGLL